MSSVKSLISKNLHLLCTLLFGVAVVLFFGQAYPHHLHYQEQFQLFLFDSTYVWEIVRVPGGVADLLGRFSTQFFLYAWVGALIIAVLLSAVQLLTLRLSGSESLYGLSFVPAFLLWLFLLDENALMGGVWGADGWRLGRPALPARRLGDPVVAQETIHYQLFTIHYRCHPVALSPGGPCLSANTD